MEDPRQRLKSESDSINEDDLFDLPSGDSVEVPVVNSIEDLLEGFEPFRRYWMAHLYDPNERLASKNPERFEM